MPNASSSALLELLDRERLPISMLETIDTVYAPLASHLATKARAARPALIGLCGPQGSGKSTVALILRELLAGRGHTVAVLSLDDFYLTHAERQQLASTIHPLLATRGVPGTHDVALAMRTLDALGASGCVALPSFDKARDDRRPASDWMRVSAPVDFVLFEGWCVGARPQSEAALEQPINDLERGSDPDGRWRCYVNARLQDDYAALFARIDELILLKAPAFESVYEWRAEQEHKLRDRVERSGAEASGLMNEPALRRFIAHYERLTRHIMSEMPARADVVIELNQARRVNRVQLKSNRP